MTTGAALLLTACGDNAQDADRFERVEDRADIENPNPERREEAQQAPTDSSYRHEAPFDVTRDD